MTLTMFLDYRLDVVVDELIDNTLDIFVSFHAPTPFWIDCRHKGAFRGRFWILADLLRLGLFLLFIIVRFFFFCLFAWILKERLLWRLLFVKLCILCCYYWD